MMDWYVLLYDPLVYVQQVLCTFRTWPVQPPLPFADLPPGRPWWICSMRTPVARVYTKQFGTSEGLPPKFIVIGLHRVLLRDCLGSSTRASHLVTNFAVPRTRNIPPNITHQYNDMQTCGRSGLSRVMNTLLCFKPMIRARLTHTDSAITGSTFSFHERSQRTVKLRYDPVYTSRRHQVL
jgi:hypothetical protein